MKDSGIEWIGQIPKEWKIEKLQWNMEEIIEKNSPIKVDKVLSLTKEKGVIPYDEKGNQGNKSKENLEEYKIAYIDTIVANSMNMLIGSVGISKYYGCVSPVYYVFRNNEKSDLRFLNYLFCTTQFQKQLRKFANGILEIRLRVSSESVMKQYVAFPELNQQVIIADYLDDKVNQIDIIISKTKKTIEDYKIYRQTLITQAVTLGFDSKNKIIDSEIIGLGKVRKDAEILKFKYVGMVKSNLVKVEEYLEFPQISPDKIEKGSGKLLFYNKVKDAGVISDNHFFYKGMIVYSKIRPLLNKAIIAEFDGLCSADMYPIESYINTKYLLYYILSNAFLGQISVSDNRVKMPKLNKEELSEIRVVVPNEEEQQEIVEYLDKKCSEIDILIEKKEILIKELESYKKSLIYEYVTGKKEVQ